MNNSIETVGVDIHKCKKIMESLLLPDNQKFSQIKQQEKTKKFKKLLQ